MARLRFPVLPTLHSPVVTWGDVFSRSPVLLFTVSLVLILAIGLASLTSLTFGAAPADARAILERQLGALAVGFILAVVCAHVDYRIWRSAHWVLFFATIAFLFALLFFAPLVRGSRAWLFFGGVSVQGSEVAKFAFLVFLASYAARWTRELRKLKHLLMSLLGATAVVMLIFFEPDIGGAALYILLWVSFMLAIGLDRRQLFILALSAIALAAVLWFALLAPYQQERVRTFLHPGADPQGSGYNLRQSLAAIGSAGWFGRGFAGGSQSQLRYLPESQSDFLFAVVAENFGFVGVLLLLMLWMGVLGSLLFLFPQFVDDFAAFFCLAFSLLLFWEAVIPIAISLGLLPVTGLTLPFMGAGGSSLVIHLALVGVLFNIMKNTPRRLRVAAVDMG
jgi:rod shape determining protein RodA